MHHVLSKKIASMAPSATEEVDNEVKRLLREGVKDMISLGVGEPCFDTPPNIKKAASDALMAGKTKYEPTAGDYALREAICAKLKAENGLRVTLHDVMVTPGAKYSIYLTFQSLIEPGDRVILLDPAWVTYEPAAQMAGAEVVRLASRAEDGFQPDLDRIRKAMDRPAKIIVVNSPCNPTGTVFAEETVREIAKMARDRETYVLSDEIYEYLVYDRRPYSPASEFENVITVNGFSKSYAMTGWRLGYVAAPKEILEGMLKISQHSTSCVTAFAQAGALEALTSETSCRAAKEMVRGYAERRALMMDLLAKSEFLDCRNAPGGAFYCFPAYRSCASSVELSKELLQEAHVATVPGVAFGECGEGHLRLSYATSKEAIAEAFSRMEDFFKKCTR